MNIVVLDGYTVNPGDLDWDVIREKGSLTVHDRSAPDEIVPRSRDADVLLVNKVKIGEKEMEALPSLKAICMLATGYDNVDVKAAEKKEIKVYNAVGYGSESVAQHAMSLMLAFTNRIEAHHLSVQAGDWTAQEDFSYTLHSVFELSGKTLGIFGYGKIGGRLAEIALAFGMKVLATSRSSREVDEITFVDQEFLFANSDFLSLHAPLTPETKQVINKDSLSSMRKNAIIINTGRGGLINETDLVEAVTNRTIAGAGLDVLTKEPPYEKNPLLHVKNIIVTPHMAWRSKEARTALLRITADNIDRALTGATTNRVV